MAKNNKFLLKMIKNKIVKKVNKNKLKINIFNKIKKEVSITRRK